MASNDDKFDFTNQVRRCSDRLAEAGVDALAPLFDLTSQRLVRFAVTLTRHQHDAEDAVQTALVRVAGRPKLLKKAKCPWAYLLRMVRNEAHCIARRQRTSTNSNLSDLVTFCPVDELEHKEQHLAVWSAMRNLPPAQAEVIVLKIWEAMTFSQIGEILEISPNTVASRYQYAIEKLSKRLLPQQPEVRS